jgi:hypothetical protein
VVLVQHVFCNFPAGGGGLEPGVPRGSERLFRVVLQANLEGEQHGNACRN